MNTCTYKFTRGAKKGLECGKKIFVGTPYCSEHKKYYNSALSLNPLTHALINASAPNLLVSSIMANNPLLPIHNINDEKTPPLPIKTRKSPVRKPKPVPNENKMDMDEDTYIFDNPKDYNYLINTQFKNMQNINVENDTITLPNGNTYKITFINKLPLDKPPSVYHNYNDDSVIYTDD
jgi:hypothetical protein